MEHLVYISSACHFLNQDDLLDILVVSQQNNQRNSLTGMLLYGEGTFIQVLEGEPAALTKTYDLIVADPRHKNIILITRGEIAQRSFPKWVMGFKTINAQELEEVEAYVNPVDSNFLSKERSNKMIAIMKTFVDTNRMLDN
jgi:hypothetical protein